MLSLVLTAPKVTISVQTDRGLNRFVPALALGAGIDGADLGETGRVFTPRNEAAMASAGLGALTYRLRTELGGEAWHWNPRGHFSAGDQGYWTSDDRPGPEIRKSYGYRLPRRGDTDDQANNDGYSRLVDGREGTFWKSNPYLDDARPQWVILDLRHPAAVDALRIRWADPYALRTRVEYWDGQVSDDFGAPHAGEWRAFPNAEARGRGGDELHLLGGVGRPVQYVRIWLLASSHTPRRATDPRDAKGFAIREISLGHWTGTRLVDAVRHRPDRRQTACYVSSTDPWHRASDRDPNVEQPGLDLVARSPLSRGLPMLLPVPVLYGTPEDAAAFGRWLRARHFPVRGFEMGEEPDGQICSPEDYGTLELLMADALRQSLPSATIGGPAFQTVEYEYGGWAISPSPSGFSWRGGRGERQKGTWIERFAAFLRARNRLNDLGFVSFEWYPFDAVWADPAPQLAKHPAMLHAALQRLKVAGVPLLMTEYGYSAFAGPAEVDLPGAILNLDLVGTFLSEGGRAAFLYGYPPAALMTEHRGQWGNLALFLSGDDGQWRHRLPTYWAARMMTQDWCGSFPPLAAAAQDDRPSLSPTVSGRRSQGWGSDQCDLLSTQSPDPLVASYTVRRPDGHLAVLLLNKDPRQPRTVDFSVDGRVFSSGNLVQYGPAQYAWKKAGKEGHPIRAFPPVRSTFRGPITLPPYSMTVATVTP